MSDSLTSEKKPWYQIPMHRNWRMALGVAIAMVLLALLGVGLTTSDRAIAPKYWMGLVPVYGGLCIATAWSRSRSGDGGQVLIVKQVFHWVVIAFAMWLNFYIQRTGQEPGVAAGDVELMLLALGCLLAGVHLEAMFVIVGLLLILTLFVVVRAEQYMWVIVVFGLLAIGGLAGVWRMMAARHLEIKASK